MDKAMQGYQEGERANLMEALRQERERSDLLADENKDLLDALRLVSDALDGVGAFIMQSAYSRSTDGGQIAEWRESIARKREDFIARITAALSSRELEAPKRKRKARA